MEKPVLVIMAAGMGSRYGGLKQIDPIDNEGHIIMDFSLFDAKRAGFEKVIFIIKRETEDAFREVIGNRIGQYMDVSYAFQELSNLPIGYQVPEGRVKPWGTAHAVLSCIHQIHSPFAVINADDYYGKDAFQLIFDYLSEHQDNVKYRYAMVGYHLGNTVTENGHVARGICKTNTNHELTGIVERTHIETKDNGIAFTEDEGKTWNYVPAETIVSMNMWGFQQSFLNEIQNGFIDFLEDGLQNNPLKCEYFLPSVVGRLIKEDLATVSVLESPDKWYGVTYKEDKPIVEKAVKSMKEQGLYPEHLWEA